MILKQSQSGVMYHDLGNTLTAKIEDMAYTLNPNAPKVRWDAVKLVRGGWSMRKVGKHLGYSVGAVSKWVKRAGYSWYGPLPTKSSRPKKSPTALSKEVVSAIIEKRIGRRRCGQVIHQELLRDGIKVSLPSVQRTLGRLGMLKKRSPWKRPHDYTLRPLPAFPGALLEADTVHIQLPDGSKIYIYTLIDLYSRWAYAEVARKISGNFSAHFIIRAKALAPFKLEMIQTDNGAEFQKMFRFQIYKLGLTHRYSRVRQSNDQAHIERFNRTIQEECFDLTTQTIRNFRGALKKYLPYYNSERLHMGIGFRTPTEILNLFPRS